MTHIFKRTVLFPATQGPEVENLAKLAFEKNEDNKEKMVYIRVDDDNTKATVEGFQQGYCVILVRSGS
ncbi:unnamed protein product [Urochloa humidicola]